MIRKMIILGLSMVVISMSGCKSEPKVDEVPVQEIEPTEPPAYEAPAKPVERRGSDGVFKVAEKKYFGAVTPVTARELSCNRDECLLIVPRMNASDVERFLEKYFPYQKMTHFVKANQFELYPTIKEEYREDGIVPDLDPNIFKPKEVDAVFIRVYWSKRDNEYVWLYRSPLTRRVAVDPNDIPVVDETPLTEEEIRSRDIEARKQQVADLERTVQEMESSLAEARLNNPERVSDIESGLTKYRLALEESRKGLDAERSKFE